MKTPNQRQRAALLLLLALLFLLLVALSGYLLQHEAMATDLSQKNLSPSLRHPFGTDWMGRDMLARTLCGLSMSIRIGLITATVSALLALALGSAAALGGRWADSAVTWLIDLVMGIPHLLLLILISFAVGKGFRGVVVGVIFSHWMQLARVIRGELLQLRQSGFVLAARRLGKGRLYLLGKHMLPHLLPQFMVGLVLLFPHAILHEASITFLGFGLSQEQPAIGVILSESMRYLSMGYWWLAALPGLLLVFTVLLFDLAGNCLRQLTSPASLHQ